MIPTVMIVGADKGGVGKTMTCRVLLDYLAARGITARVFDAQWPGGDLVRFATDAMKIDIAAVPDQMRVFDGLEAVPYTVIDLPAGLMSPTIRALEEARLLEDVRAGSVRMVLLHVLGPTVASIGEVATAAERIGAVRHLLVKNHISEDAQYFDWDQGPVRAIFERMADKIINIRKLDGMACELMQKRGDSFDAFCAEATASRVLRGRVRSWIESVWAEFDRVKLIDA